MAVLGAILFDNNAQQRVSDVLKPKDFYAPANAAIFEVLDRLISGGRVADGVTLREHFDRDGKLVEIGGARYLADLLDSAAFGPEIVDYARLVHDLSLRRELIDIGAGIVQKATSSDIEEPGETQIQDAEKRLFALAERGAVRRASRHSTRRWRHSIETATLAFKRDGKIAGVPSGLRRSRPDAGRPAQVGPRHPRGASLDGEDRAGDQHRRTTRRSTASARPARTGR